MFNVCEDGDIPTNYSTSNNPNRAQSSNYKYDNTTASTERNKSIKDFYLRTIRGSSIMDVLLQSQKR